VGDFHLYDAEGNIVAIIERKTHADLGASIIDGRFRNQRDRLSQTGVPVIYIVEAMEQWDYTTLSLVYNLHKTHGMTVFTTRDKTETQQCIEFLYKKTIAPKTDTPSAEENLVRSRLSNVKKDSMTPRTYFIHCLCGLPSVSYKIASDLCQSYRSDIIGFFRDVCSDDAVIRYKNRVLKKDRFRSLLQEVHESS
jgi:ERCC4-type nuclease